MDKNLFVGREAELARLFDWTQAASQGRGGIVLVAGEAGIGKSQLLEVLEADALNRAAFNKAHFVHGYCYQDVGEKNAYQPLVDVLGELARSDRKGGDLGKLALTILKEVGPDWLQMIPGLGAAVSAGIKTITLTGEWFLKPSADKLEESAALVTQYIRAITDIASRYRPLVLVIEDAHWIDEASAQLLVRLAPQLSSLPLLILLTYRPSFVPAVHPLKDLQGELLAHNLAHTLELTGLPHGGVCEYLLARFGSQLNPQLASWLVHLCNGNPLFISQYLSLLEQNQAIHPRGESYVLAGDIDFINGQWTISKNIPIPESIEAVLSQRIQRLLETDRQMLQQAAIQGESFMSTILSEILGVRELEILPRLRALVEEHRLIRYGESQEGWTSASSDVYVFEHALMHRVFYQKLSPRERVLYHREVASIIERGLEGDPNPNRKLIIQVAHHYDYGDEPLKASQYYLRAARSSLANGAFSETVRLCQHSLEGARRLREGVEVHDRMRAESIFHLLMASKLHWSSTMDSPSDLPLESMAAEAQAAADRVGDLSLQAEIMFLTGNIYIVTQSFTTALGAMHTALDLARKAADPLTEFIILSNLGHHTANQSLEEALQFLYQAEKIYTEQLTPNPPSAVQAALLSQSYHQLESMIGVAEFDRGNFGAAMNWLLRSLEGVKALKSRDLLLAPYNFLGQVYISAGLFEQAEANLEEATRLFADEAEPNAWNAYNLALLGKLYLEWGRPEDAIKPLVRGWQDTQSAWFMAMANLVRNYYAELLMHPDSSLYDPVAADQLLKESYEQAHRDAAHRSAIAALMLRGRLALSQGQLEGALAYTTQAVDYLQSKGLQLPALRTEEVLFAHYQALLANGLSQEALPYLRQANEFVQRKAATLDDESQRRNFLERVPVNQAIIAALQL